VKHRLPESHDCTGLHEAKEEEISKRMDDTLAPVQPPREFSRFNMRKDVDETEVHNEPNYCQFTYSQPYEVKISGRRFSRIEVRHLLVASCLLILLSLSWSIPSFPLVTPQSFDLTSFIILTVVLFLCFLPHELMHKAIAQRYSLLAEFRIIPSYAMLTALTIVLPVFKIFAPGAVMIAGEARPEAYGKTAAAGPAINVALGATMVGLLFLFPDFAYFFWLGAYLSGWLAFFNMIPIAPLDGQKILRWNKAAFSVLFVSSIALFAYASFLLVA